VQAVLKNVKIGTKGAALRPSRGHTIRWRRLWPPCFAEIAI
jgi:hypothetical protein